MTFIFVYVGPLHQEPGQTGVGQGQTWPESRGEPGLWPAFGQVGQGIKKPGKPRPQGQPGLALPRLAGAKIGKEKRKKKRSAWPGKAMAGQGQNWQVKPCKEFIFRKFKVWPAIQLIALRPGRPGLAGAKHWSSLPRNLGQPGQADTTMSILIINCN